MTCEHPLMEWTISRISEEEAVERGLPSTLLIECSCGNGGVVREDEIEGAE